MNEIKERIYFVMSVVFDIDKDQINDNSEPGLIENWDSLRHMNLIVALEEEFDIVFSDDEMTELLNMKLILSVISDKLN
jgi:acyl carrier protein